MASLTIRKLDDDLRDLLRQRAARNGVSMEEEARRALQNWVHRTEEGGLGTRMRKRFAEVGMDDFQVAQRDGGARPLPEIFSDER